MLISLASLLGGILNSLDKFWVNAAAPILLNIAMVSACCSSTAPPYETARPGDRGAVGGVLQLGWLLDRLPRRRRALRPRRPRLDPTCAADEADLPAAAGAGAVQINLVISTALAGALLAEGSISYIYYADRLNQLPLGMIGIGLGTILLPTISRLLGAGRTPRRWRRRIAASSWRCSSPSPRWSL
jgi:putative peptidoglycan lipid II flippase